MHTLGWVTAVVIVEVIVNENAIAIEKSEHDMIEKLEHAVIVEPYDCFKWRVLWLLS